MTLFEIGVEYEASASLLRARLKTLRRELKNADNPTEEFKLKRRIAELTPLLTECNKLAKFCKCYYEKGYYINGGAFDKQLPRQKTTGFECESISGFRGHFETRVDRPTTTGFVGVSIQAENISRLSGRIRGKQIDCLENVLQSVK